MRAKFWKNQWKRLKNQILQFFELYISVSANPRKIISKKLEPSWYDIKKKKINIYKQLVNP